MSAMEHNAVMRPLQRLAKQGVLFDRIPCNGDGFLDLAALEGLFRPNTRLVVLAHASNVSGTVQDAAAVSRLCAAHGVPFCLDAAQTAGHLPLSFRELGLSALSVPAHKGLMGPQGLGALLLAPDFAAALDPYVTGAPAAPRTARSSPPICPINSSPAPPTCPASTGGRPLLHFCRISGWSRSAPMIWL